MQIAFSPHTKKLKNVSTGLFVLHFIAFSFLLIMEKGFPIPISLTFFDSLLLYVCVCVYILMVYTCQSFSFLIPWINAHVNAKRKNDFVPFSWIQSSHTQ